MCRGLRREKLPQGRNRPPSAGRRIECSSREDLRRRPALAVLGHERNSGLDGGGGNRDVEIADQRPALPQGTANPASDERGSAGNLDVPERSKEAFALRWREPPESKRRWHLTGRNGPAASPPRRTRPPAWPASAFRRRPIPAKSSSLPCTKSCTNDQSFSNPRSADASVCERLTARALEKQRRPQLGRIELAPRRRDHALVDQAGAIDDGGDLHHSGSPARSPAA